MERRPTTGPPSSALIEQTSPRAVFAELLAGALGETGVQPTPMAVAYLIELLDGRVRASPAPPGALGGEPTLAETLLRARLERGAQRIRQLRELGDRALFVSGFFGDSLARSAVDLGYYGEAGRCAYGDLSSELASRLGEPSWARLYEELADRFGEFADVLAEVSDRTCGGRPASLLRLYDRYLETGSARDWRRLARRGHVPTQIQGLRRWQ